MTNRKTLRLRKRNTKKLKRKQRGGALYEACVKYEKNNGQGGAPGHPAPQKKGAETNSMDGNVLNELTRIIDQNVNNSTTIILKIGTNDNAARPGNQQKTGKQAEKYFLEKGISSFNPENVVNICISPDREYSYFMHPFDDREPEKSNPAQSIFSSYQNHGHKYYIQGYFPIVPEGNQRKRELLNRLIQHEGPIFLFNAMGSWCYNIFKYIIDMRTGETGYGGLVDTTNYLSKCEPEIKLYPNPDERCEGVIRAHEQKMIENLNTKSSEKFFKNENPSLIKFLEAYASRKFPKAGDPLYRLPYDNAYKFLKLQPKLLEMLKPETRQKLINQFGQ